MLLFTIGHYDGISKLLEGYSWEIIFIYVLLCPVFLLLYTAFFISVSYCLVLVWLRNTEDLFHYNQEYLNKIEWAEVCIKIYNRMEIHFGVYFLFYFTMSQFIWTILFYLAISLAISNNGFSTESVLLQSLGFKIRKKLKIKKKLLGPFLFSIAYLIFLKFLIFQVDSIYRSFKKIKLELEDIDVEDKEDSKRVSKIIDVIDSAEPLSGCGMFHITRSTLTSMISTSITYLIILVQFKISFL